MNNKNLKENVDEWIKQINNRLDTIEKDIEELNGLVQHDYELIYELKNDIEAMWKVVKAIAVIERHHLKNIRCQ